MNILIACDSFKDALAAVEVCSAIERGLTLANPSFKTRIFPLADGGEGVKDILDFHLGLETKTVEVHNPLFRKIKACYSLVDSYLLTVDSKGVLQCAPTQMSTDNCQPKTAFIEMAQAAGLQLLKTEERNPLKTTTFGVGEIILDAIKHGAKQIIIGIGGSATNDLGIGMAAALGWKFLDKNKKELIPIGENLIYVETIIPPNKNLLEKVDFEVMCDVNNPLLGKSGAAHTYAKQKGASAEEILALEEGAKQLLSEITKSSLGRRFSVIEKTLGAGAAGGFGFGCLHFLNAKIKSGITTIMDLTDFDKQVAWADIIFTGEGQIDSQTAQGKLISGIIARSQNKSVIALCGSLNLRPKNLTDLGLKAVFPINPKITSLSEALKNTAENLEMTAFNIARLLVMGDKR